MGRAEGVPRMRRLPRLLRGPPRNLEPFRKEAEWTWRKLEWECVVTGIRTGRVLLRIDIDDTPSRAR